jgi:hypothetical protein
LMVRSARHSEDAEARFREALDIAGQQGARFWELRSAVSLARCMIGAGHSANALAVLDNVCGAFAEGSDFADMRIARDLIEQLRA